MKVGDSVQFYEDRGGACEDAVVVALYGSCWARLRTTNGDLVEDVFVASTHFQSPAGHYCLPRLTSEAERS